MFFVTTDEILLPDSRRIRKLHFCTFPFLHFNSGGQKLAKQPVSDVLN